MYNYILSILIILNIFSIIIGYLLGRIINPIFIDNKISYSNTKNTTTKSNTINIDESKYVTSISTSNLEKKYETLGDIKNSSENIESSINKLKNMKG